MEKSTLFVVSALCILSLIGQAQCKGNRFFVEGTVYCDTCRSQFLTRISEFMAGATVRVECKEIEGGNLTFSQEAVTDQTGTYKMEVDGDHEEEICEVVLVKSSQTDCAEIDEKSHLYQAARISITKNNGMVSSRRVANPLGFLKAKPNPECSEVLKELGLKPDLSLI